MPAESRGTLGGALLGLLSAGLGLGAAFGLQLSTTEHDAIIAFATAALVVAPVVGALFDHSRQQASARVEAAATLANGGPQPSSVVTRIEAAVPVLSEVEQLQARIDALTAERDRLGGRT